MIFDVDSLPDEATNRSYDVCVIGGGAAGITLALKLAGQGKSVAVCEGGPEEFDNDSQDIYIGDVFGDPYFDLDSARLRYLGGSTNHWAGTCRSFEEADFERSHLGSVFEWPIGKSEFDKYFDEAVDILKLNPDFNDQIVDPEYGIKKFVFRSSRVNFGVEYKDFFETSNNADLYLNANLTGLELGEIGRRIRSVELTGYNGKTLNVASDAVVFAMGGIENSRQLLHFFGLHGEALCQSGLPIGQYWMEHPHFNLGEALVSQKVQQLKFVSLTSQIQKELGILGCGFRIDIQGGTATRRLVRDLLCVAPNVGGMVAKLADKNLVCGVRVKAAWEQAPEQSSRIELSKEKTDRFGVPLTELHWQKSDLDRVTLAKSCWQFAQFCMARGYGRFKLQEWLLTGGEYPENDELAGFHHMGGTRMSASAAFGVVDGNCKVFGSENLYMAGSSVFTTSGHNNPTLPIVQLAVRLGEHLSEKV